MASSAVKTFVSSCRRFSDGSSDAEDISNLREVTEIRMPLHYRMPFPEPVLLEQQPSSEDQQRHLRGLWHELVQHLRDLRYLTEKEFVQYHQQKKHILDKPYLLNPVLEAANCYLQEEKEWPELAVLLPASETVDRYWLSQHLSAVVTRIGFHTIWDGSALVPKNYTVGEETVFGRALAFRLRTLSSAQFRFASVEKYYRGEDNPVLDELFSEGFSRRGSTTVQSIPRGYWSALGNLDQLLTSYIGKEGREELIILYQIAAAEDVPQTDLDKLKKKDLEFQQANWKTFHEGTARRIYRRAKRQKDREDAALGIRLLQIKLWQAGYYTGAIDGAWGEVSHRGLAAFLMDKATEKLEQFPTRKPNRSQPAEVRKTRSLLTVVNRENRVYAADFTAVLQLLKAEDKLSENILHLDADDNDLKTLPQKAGIKTTEFDEKVLREEGLGDLYPNNVVKPERRVSFFRRLGGVIVGGIKKVITWLKKGVESLLGPVFSFVKLLLRPIRNAVHRFFQGFKYLANFVFGRPLFTETAAATATTPARIFATKFQLDFDAVNFAPAGYQPEEPAIHAAHIQRMQTDMAYFIDGVIWVIKAIGKLTNPGGWVWLGWQIVRGVKKGIPDLIQA